VIASSILWRNNNGIGWLGIIAKGKVSLCLVVYSSCNTTRGTYTVQM
jgi:hypothetical protein